MLRIVPAFIGLGVIALWVVGLALDAAGWLVWGLGASSLALLAIAGLVPPLAGSRLAALCLALTALALLGLWAAGLASRAAPRWLAWWAFVAACATLLTAGMVAGQGALDRLRTRAPI